MLQIQNEGYYAGNYIMHCYILTCRLQMKLELLVNHQCMDTYIVDKDNVKYHIAGNFQSRNFHRTTDKLNFKGFIFVLLECQQMLAT